MNQINKKLPLMFYTILCNSKFINNTKLDVRNKKFSSCQHEKTN
jgi:hypothetical protein